MKTTVKNLLKIITQNYYILVTVFTLFYRHKTWNHHLQNYFFFPTIFLKAYQPSYQKLNLLVTFIFGYEKRLTNMKPTSATACGAGHVRTRDPRSSWLRWPTEGALNKENAPVVSSGHSLSF